MNISVKKSSFAVFATTLLLLVVFLFSSCDMDDNLTESFADQDSFEAKLDDAVIKMDAQKYQEAKTIIDELLLEKPGDEYLIELRASCYVGIAGIDSLSALEKIDNVADAGDLNTSDIIATIIGDANGEITSAGISDTISNLTSALDDLTSIANPNEDQLSQIALFSAYRVLATVASECITQFGSDPLDLDDPATDFSTLDGSAVSFTLAERQQIADDFTNMFKIPTTNVLYEPVSELADAMGTTTPTEADIATWLTNLTN